MLAETSGLTSSEFASVLATSGTTGAEGEIIGNSWKFSHLVEAFCTQRGDAALAARDAKAWKSEAVVAAVDNFDLSELSEAAARIENAISWNETDPQIVGCEDDDDDHYEEDVDWYADSDSDSDSSMEASRNTDEHRSSTRANKPEGSPLISWPRLQRTTRQGCTVDLSTA